VSKFANLLRVLDKWFVSGVTNVSPTLTSTPINLSLNKIELIDTASLIDTYSLSSANSFVDSPEVDDWLWGAGLEGFPGVVADSVHFVYGFNTGDNRPVCLRVCHLVTFSFWFGLFIGTILGICNPCGFHEWKLNCLNYWSWQDAAHRLECRI
jgi:hypothetical protein